MLDTIWGRMTQRQREALILCVTALAFLGFITAYAVVNHQTCVGITPHTVRSGETYHSIALAEKEAGHYQVRDLRIATEAMRELNPDISPQALPSGGQVNIPARCG